MAKLSDYKTQRVNANKHTERGIAALDNSIKRDGWIGAVTVAADGETFDGSARLEALADAMPSAEPIIVESDGTRPVIVRRTDIPDTDDPRAKRLGVAANVIAHMDYAPDGDILAMIAADDDAVARLIRQDEASEEAVKAALADGLFGDGDAEPQIDRAAELNEKWQVKRGDLWRIGDHRLLCGDSTKREDVERVMQGEKAALCFTSPPYAEQRKEQYGGTSEEKYWDWFTLIQSEIKYALKHDGNFVLNIKPNAKEYQRSLYVFDLVCSMVRLEEWLFVDEFCWLRTGIPQQVVNRFKNAFEPCYWFAASDSFEWFPDNVKHESDSVPIAPGKGAGDTNAARRQGKGGGAIQGNKIASGFAYPSNVLNFKQNAEALGHPAAFPVELPTFFVKAMSASGECVYEPFSGSGTTLVACQNLQRKCRAIEISPNYCAVILERMSTAFPGIVIERVADGQA